MTELSPTESKSESREIPHGWLDVEQIVFHLHTAAVEVGIPASALKGRTAQKIAAFGKELRGTFKWRKSSVRIGDEYYYKPAMILKMARKYLEFCRINKKLVNDCLYIFEKGLEM